MQKRKTLSLQQKQDIINNLDKKIGTQKSLANIYGVDQSTISKIYQKKAMILSRTNNKHVKSLKGAQYDNMEKCLVDYVSHLRSNNLPVSGDLIREKALEFANKAGNSNFKASNGWFENFKQRNNIRHFTISGSENLVDESIVSTWKEETYNTIFSKYEKDNIYNADETGLFYELMPASTYNIFGSQNKSSSKSKKRVTVLLCTNMTGNKKLMPLVIGNSKNPRCFKGIKSFPVEYDGNKSSWMTSELFSKFVTDLNDKQKKIKTKVCLILDNAPVHNIICDQQFDYVDVIFLPKNTTSRLQPLDCGIIRSFKCHYRRYLLKTAIEMIDNNQKVAFTILDAIRMVAKSWNAVNSDVISNCFYKAFRKDNYNISNEDDILIREEIQSFEKKLDLPNNRIVEIDKKDLYENPSFNDIMDKYISTECEEDEAAEEPKELPTVSLFAAEKAFETLETFLLQHKDTPQEKYTQLYQLKQFVEEQSRRNSTQAKITMYFK